MIRNLKALGLAFAAMLCMGAVAASAASAQQGVLTSDGPVTLTGEQTGELFDNAQTGAAGTITCPGGAAVGHKVLTQEETEEEREHELVESGATTLTITPHKGICQAHVFFNLITLPVTSTANGCDVVGHIGETEGKGTYAVTVDIVCPPEKVIETHFYEEDSTEHLPEEAICTTKVQPQSGLEGLHITVTPESEDLDISGTLVGLHTENSGPACGEGTDTSSPLHMDVTVVGHNELAEPTPVSISH